MSRGSRARLGRLGFRLVLVAASCLMVAVWVRTGRALTEHFDSARGGAADAASRYVEAQEALSTVRTMTLLTSVRVRDVLLEPASGDVHEDRRQVEAAYRLIKDVLEDYPAVPDGASQHQPLARLAAEIEQLYAASLSVLDEGAHSAAMVREALHRRIVPRRDAALAIADEIQTENRAAFVARQADMISAQRAIDARTRRELGAALIIGLGAMLLAGVYAARLESRLRRLEIAAS